MTDLKINEAVSVQFPMVRQAVEIGWLPLLLEVAIHKRGGTAGMIFRDELEGVLGRFNLWMTDNVIR